MRTRKQELVSDDLKPFVCNIMKEYIDLDEVLKSIIQYSSNISVLYQNAATAKINEEEEEYQTQLDYIALAEEYEEKEYQKIDFENNLNERLYRRFLQFYIKYIFFSIAFSYCFQQLFSFCFMRILIGVNWKNIFKRNKGWICRFTYT